MNVSEKNEAKTVIQNLFIVLKNQYLSTESIKATKNNLVQLAWKHKKIIEENENEAQDEFDLSDEVNKYKSKFRRWIEEIVKGVDDKFVDHDSNNRTVGDSADHEINYFFFRQIGKTNDKYLV